MSERMFSFLAGLIFLVVAVLHVMRLALGWNVVLAGWTIPTSVSWVAFPIAGYLAFEGLRHSIRR
jgi:hypothetical protein